MNVAWARVLFTSLRDAGAGDVIVSPGSRSTPLVLAAAEVGLRLHPIIDERSAAFFALGRARETGAPPILVCTSGSAGAHYLPAIIEASQSGIPLIAITADRPPELQGCAAPQTIDQTRLYGVHVRLHADLGLPEARADRLFALRRRAAQAVAASLGPIPGPVHLNAPARKPLEASEEDRVLEPLCRRALEQPLTRAVASPAPPAGEGCRELAAALAKARRPLLVAGPAPASRRGQRAAIYALARKASAPLLCESTSQLRFAGEDLPPFCIDAFEPLVRAREAGAEPDLVIQLGAPPTSAALRDLGGAGTRWVIAPHGWNDPSSDAAALLVSEVGPACAKIAELLPEPPAARRERLERFAGANRAAWAAQESLPSGPPLREPEAVRAAIGALPPGALLCLGNSLPVRLADSFCPGRSAALDVASQRGAAGIDGLISGAAGAASASGRPTALLCGDVSFSHDVGGLAAARRATVPLALIVLDNGGGRIFDQLPIGRAGLGALYERCFLTPPALDLERAAAAFDVAYQRSAGAADLERAVRRATERPGCTILHAEVAPESAAADLQAWCHQVAGDVLRIFRFSVDKSRCARGAAAPEVPA